MGKKQDQTNNHRKYLTYTQNTDELFKVTLKKKENEFKQFLWVWQKNGMVSLTGQNTISEYINKISRINSQMNQKQKQAEKKEKQKYARRKKIFNVSLKDKYSNLLKGIIQQSVPQYKQELTQDQQRQMKKIQKIYAKYQVVAMFRHNLTRQIKLKHLDSLITKKYLKSKKTLSRQTIQSYKEGIEKMIEIQKCESIQIIELAY